MKVGRPERSTYQWQQQPVDSGRGCSGGGRPLGCLRGNSGGEGGDDGGGGGGGSGEGGGATAAATPGRVGGEAQQ